MQQSLGTEVPNHPTGQGLLAHDLTRLMNGGRQR